jgi:polar amino acid transport system substrate-binding protein
MKMLKQLPTAIVSGLVLAAGLAPAAIAETVLEKVTRTGVLTVGARTDLIPYSYTNDQSQLVGYSVDIANLIRDSVEAYVGKPVVLEVAIANNFSERMAQLRGNQIDFTCDVVFTWESNMFADFSMSYSVSGLRLLTQKNSSLSDGSALNGNKIGIPPAPLVRAAMQLYYPNAVLVDFADLNAAVTALNQGEVDAIAGDSVVLAGYIQPLGADNYKLLPQQPLVNYGVACMTPEQNSSFLNLVDYSIARFMDRYVTQDPTAVAMINRWFGPEGVVPLGSERLDLLRGFFQFQLLTRAQVPPTGIDFRTLGE